MDASDVAAPPRLHILSAVRAHLVAILLIALAFAGLAAAASLVLPKEYAATANVLLQPLDGNPYSPSAQGSDLTNLETEAQVLSSDVIAKKVREDLPAGLGNPNVTKGLAVSIATNTQILLVTFRHTDPDIAEAVAGQYAQSFLDYRSDRRTAYLDNKQTGILERIDNLNADLAKKKRAGLSNNDPDVKSLGGQLLNLRLQLATLDAGSTNSGGEVIVAPVARVSGLVLPVGAAAVAGFLLGLFLGIAWAVLRERHTEVLRTVDDIEHLGLPVLGHLGSPKVVDGAAMSPSDAALMVGAVLNRRVQKPATIAVSLLTSEASEDVFAEDLARSLAQGQQGVLLIDGVGDTDTTRQLGLSEALSTSQDLGKLVRRVPGGFSRMSVGKKPQVGARLYGTARMDAVLEKATAQFEWVVVRGGGTDQTVGRSLVGSCRYWIPLVILGRTSREDLDSGLVWARTTGTQTLGVVAVDPSARHRPAKHEASAPVDE